MLRADWQKRRLQRVEADLHRTLLAETPGASLAAALLSDSPAAKLLARVQLGLPFFSGFLCASSALCASAWNPYLPISTTPRPL